MKGSIKIPMIAQAVFVVLVFCLYTQEALGQSGILRTFQFSQSVQIRSVESTAEGELVFHSDMEVGKLGVNGAPIWINRFSNGQARDSFIYITDLAVHDTTILIAGLYLYFDSVAERVGGVIFSLRSDGSVKKARLFKLPDGGIGTGPFLSMSADGNSIVFYYLETHSITTVLEFGSDLQLKTPPHQLSGEDQLNNPRPWCYRVTSDSLFFLMNLFSNKAVLTSIAISHDSIHFLSRSTCSIRNLSLKQRLEKPAEGYTYICAEKITDANSISGITLFKILDDGSMQSGITIPTAGGICGESICGTAKNTILLSAVSCADTERSQFYNIDSQLQLQKVISPDNIDGKVQSLLATTAPSGQILIAGNTAAAQSTMSLYHRTPPSLSGCTLQENLASVTPEVLLPLGNTTVAYSYQHIDLPEIEPHLTPIALEVRSDSIRCINEVHSSVFSSASLVYPNPVRESGTITIHIPEQRGPISSRVVLRRLTGTMVAEQQVNSIGAMDVPLSVSGLASGIYFIELQDANSFAIVWRGKVVIE